MVKKMEKNKEDEEEKSQQNYQFAMAGTWTHELCLQIWAFYPLDHSALSGSKGFKDPRIQPILTRPFAVNYEKVPQQQSISRV